MAAQDDRLALVAQIVASYLRRNSIAVNQIATVVRNAAEALADAEKQLGRPSEPGQGSDAAGPEEASDAREQEPATSAVPIKGSVQRDYLICLEDGQHVRTLKRHLQAAHGMTPQQYRAKWNLPRDYPMSAPAYSESRSAFAKARGLGRKEPAPGGAAAAVVRPDRVPSRKGPRHAQAKA